MKSINTLSGQNAETFNVKEDRACCYHWVSNSALSYNCKGKKKTADPPRGHPSSIVSDKVWLRCP
jgi:hypothetical protein